MSQALAHFAIGAMRMTLLLALAPVRVRFKQTLILLGGIWALLPDIYQLAPTYTTWMEVIHDSTAGNLFWLHWMFDLHDPTDSDFVVALAVGGWIGVAIIDDTISILRVKFANRRAERCNYGRS